MTPACCLWQSAGCQSVSASFIERDGIDTFERICTAEPSPPAAVACAALPLATFDANGDGNLSHAEMIAAEAEKLPDLLDALRPRVPSCHFSPASSSMCRSHARGDGVLESGAEYDVWRECVLRPLTRACRSRLCGPWHGVVRLSLIELIRAGVSIARCCRERVSVRKFPGRETPMLRPFSSTPQRTLAQRPNDTCVCHVGPQFLSFLPVPCAVGPRYTAVKLRGVDYGLHSVFLYCVGAHQNVYLHTDLGESCALRIVFVHFSATAAAISLDFG